MKDHSRKTLNSQFIKEVIMAIGHGIRPAALKSATSAMVDLFASRGCHLSEDQLREAESAFDRAASSLIEARYLHKEYVPPLLALML
jgi:hypothetical protein